MTGTPEGTYAVYVPDHEVLLDPQQQWDGEAIRGVVGELAGDFLLRHVFVIARREPADLNLDSLMAWLNRFAIKKGVGIAFCTYEIKYGDVRTVPRDLNNGAKRWTSFSVVTNVLFAEVPEEQGWRRVHEDVMKTSVPGGEYSADIRGLIERGLIAPHWWNRLIVADENGHVAYP